MPKLAGRSRLGPFLRSYWRMDLRIRSTDGSCSRAEPIRYPAHIMITPIRTRTIVSSSPGIQSTPAGLLEAIEKARKGRRHRQAVISDAVISRVLIDNCVLTWKQVTTLVDHYCIDVPTHLMIVVCLRSKMCH